MALQFCMAQTSMSGRVGDIMYIGHMLEGSGFHDPRARRIYVDPILYVQGKARHPGCEWLPFEEAATSPLIDENARASYRACLERAA
jgi:hypothetical protein